MLAEVVTGSVSNQSAQKFKGIDPIDRCANNNTVFFDVSMRALDGLQGPLYGLHFPEDCPLWV